MANYGDKCDLIKNPSGGAQLYQQGQQILGAGGVATYSVPPINNTVSATYLLSQTAIPVIYPPSTAGNQVNTNGSITLATALPMIYANAWVYLPAGAVVGGLAGLYYATFTSTTAGQIYTNFAAPSATVPFTPYIPSAPVAAVGNNAAFTITAAVDYVLASILVAGGAMGANGSLRVTPVFGANNTAGAKTVSGRLANQAFPIGSLATQTFGRTQWQLLNRGNVAFQIMQPSFTSSFGATANAAGIFTINTAQDQYLTFAGQLAVQTDCVTLEGFTVEVLPSP